ncbi:MAG: hypothetical protein FWC94_05660 [Bacteroidales bacterium]|nr:hypothetical protein [Bacteroidales bacterium]
MKFYSITSGNLKPLLTLLFSVFLTGIFQAQNQSISPYSRFGVGDLQPIQTPRHVAMGGLSIGLVSPLDLTTQNPASFINLDSLMVNFEVTMHAIHSRLQETVNGETTSANTNRASLGQVSFAFPITNWLRSGFGLTPGSNMSYNVRRDFGAGDTIIGERILNHTGDGGLSQLFLGIAVGTSRISVGANLNYQFGSFARNAYMFFLDTILLIPTATERLSEVDASGFFVDLGLQFRQPLSDRYQFGLGFTYRPRYSLNASKDLLELSTVRQVGVVDTIHAEISTKGTLRMPEMYRVGLSLERLGRWVIAAEYSLVDFRNYREFGRQDPNLSVSQMFRMGMEFKGRRFDNRFMNRMTYRFGFHHGTSYVAFQEQTLIQQGISFGFGVPITRRGGFTAGWAMLDVAVELGRKGNVNNPGQIQENYGRIVVGISAFDRWFIRGRFD